MTATALQSLPGASYFRLVHEFPLRPIRDQRHYLRATKIMEELALRGEANLDRGERDYLDGLDTFIAAYDRALFSERPRRGTPPQRLRSLMNDAGLASADLEKILQCSRSLISLILSGKRELSKDNVRALAKHFKMSADYFL